MEKLNDQHFNNKIYDQKLYFQSAQNTVFREKSHLYETEKTFLNTIDSIDKPAKKVNPFSLTDGGGFGKAKKELSYLHTKRQSIEDMKAELEKQRLHEMLSQSIQKKSSMKELAAQALAQLELGNTTEANDTTNLTSSVFTRTLNPAAQNSVAKSVHLRGSMSQKVLPGISPISNFKDFQSTAQDVTMMKTPNNRYKQATNILQKQTSMGHIQAFEGAQGSPNTSAYQEQNNSSVDLMRRKKAVA